MTDAAILEEAFRELPKGIGSLIYGDPDDGGVTAKDAVEWAIREIDRLREECRWIPVAEGLPTDGSTVLASDGDVVQELRYYEGFGFECLGGDSPTFTVTCWRHKPKPPQIQKVQK